MNERINELIKECTSVYDDLVYDGRDTCMKTTEYFDKEKFAELIVRECAKIAFQNDIAKFTRDGYRIGLDIQKHFGVDE